MLLISLCISFPLFAGGGCQKEAVKVYQATAQEEERSNEQITRRSEIQEAVKGMPLPHILALHRRSSTADFSKHNLPVADQKYFRACVAERYEENKEELDKMAKESDDKVRVAIQIPLARKIQHMRRQNRLTMHDRIPSNVSIQFTQAKEQAIVYNTVHVQVPL